MTRDEERVRHRIARATDEGAILRLGGEIVRARAFGYPPERVSSDEASVRRWLGEADALMIGVGTVDKRLVAYARLEEPDPRAREFLDESKWLEISRLLVDPSWRGRGVGAGMLEWLECSRTGEYKLALVVLESNQPARALYLKEGWVERGAFLARDKVGEMAIVMAKEMG